MPGMTHTIDVRQGLPPEMQVLLRDYPRDAWPDHPNFARSIRNWMGAHHMFRQLGEIATGETELYLTKGRAPEDYAVRLSEFGNLLVRNLHGHHTWEDRKFFPELAGADARFVDGLDLLETDHDTLDEVLDRFTRQSNRVIQLIHLDEAQARDEAGTLHETATEIERFLARHLADEEDLVVPIILHHKLRG
ncbi:cation-binding protein [Actibacterium pelagium]|uniref:Cation-binding protein n=2 Tax=Actibacterium pelagium TaxID=2029103 RepID=A0A917AFS9_9RHOB|nr:cation-binding protein [Actibacterium pelagium]